MKLTLNFERIYKLRRASGIETDREFAKLLKISPATLYRYSTGQSVPSNSVLARLKAHFPLVPLDDLTTLKRDE